MTIGINESHASQLHLAAHLLAAYDAVPLPTPTVFVDACSGGLFRFRCDACKRRGLRQSLAGAEASAARHRAYHAAIQKVANSRSEPQ